MANFKVDCRKFQPNMFNKIKCSHCFKQREEHTSEALESNRASRKVSKCGYLFVAPDWDFSIPLNRTKRWQRRWFVLYDDGELTYSVDDLPATIPQSSIDMNRVLEVSDAEDVTGNQFALAITSADRATFVKGTSREESKWWKDVLSVFPKQHGRHKRNATFPGIKASSNILQHSRTSFSRTTPASLAQSFDSSGTSRPRFLSCTSSILDTGRPSSAPSFESPDDEVFPIKDHVTSTPINSPAYARIIREDHKENTPPYVQGYVDHPPTSESPPTQDKLPLHRPRTRRMAKREARGLTEARNDLSRKLILSDLEDCKREEKLKDIADSITRPRNVSKKSYTKEKPTREKDVTMHSNPTSNKTEPVSFDSLSMTEHIRGDPDGLEGAPIAFTSNPDIQRVDLPAEDILHLKKGWLLKQGIGQEWNKYWFVLQGSALSFYRDPNAEDNGIMDGIVDLGMAKKIEELEVGRNYGFKITMWEDKTLIFSAVTLGIRTNWIKALKNAANMDVNSILTITDPIDMKIMQQNIANSKSDNKEKSLDEIDLSRRNIFSDEDEYRTANESFFNTSSLDSSFGTLNGRRGRSQSRESVGGRSSSSPPGSRRCTRDDIQLNQTSESLHSFSGLENTDSSEKASNGTLASSGETALVDLLETQVESLKSKLELTQAGYVDLRKENDNLRTQVTSVERDGVGSFYGLTTYSQLSFCGEDILIEECSNSSLIPESIQNSISSLTSDTASLKHRLEVFEHDLQRIENETACVRIDKKQLTGQANALRAHSVSLKMKTEELQRRILEQERELLEKKSLIAKLEQLDKQFKEERSDMCCKLQEKDKKIKDLNESLQQREESVQNLHRMLLESEDKIKNMTRELKNNNNNEEITRLRSDNIEILKQKAGLIAQISSMEEDLSKESSEVKKWKHLVQELKSLVESRNEEAERKRKEANFIKETLKSTQQDLTKTSDRLHRGIEENECLCKKVRELERALSAEKNSQSQRGSNLSITKSSSKKNLPRPNSLSDLTNFDFNMDPEELEKECLVDEFIDLRNRFETAISEVRAMKREMRDMQTQQDDLQLLNQRYEIEIKANEDTYNSQIHLMSERVQDLTNKLTTSEKQARLLKQKLTKAENKEKRRSHSLKGKESFSLSKDIESKLQELESKVQALLNEDLSMPSPGSESTNLTKRSHSFDESTKASRLRRKSLDGSVSEDAIKTILRINQLGSKVETLTRDEETKVHSSISSTNSSLTNVASVAANSTSQTPISQTASSPGSPLRSPLRSPSTIRRSMRSSRSTPEKQVKLTRSESDVRVLRDKISFLEKVMNSLQSKLNECAVWATSVEASCTCGKPSVQKLQYQIQSSLKLIQTRYNKNSSVADRLRPFCQRVYDLLKEKITQLSKKRQQLRFTGKWTRDAQLKLFAERLAFETVLLSQIGQLLTASQRPESYESSIKFQELIEAHRKLTFLEKKLSQSDFDMEPMTPLDFYTSLLAEKLVVEGDLMSQLVSTKPSSTKTTKTYKDLHQKLLEREKQLASNITDFKENKLHNIAVVMAKETIMGTQPDHDDNTLMEELRLREAWIIAQELVTQELVNIEASHSMLRLSNLLTPERNSPSVITDMSAVTIDRLQTGAEESLRQEMEESVFTLSNKYEEVLAKYRKGDTSIIHSVSSNIDELLHDFAAVIAQKALLDGQLAVATDDESLGTASEALTIEENPDILNAAVDVTASESHLLMFLGATDSSIERLVQTSLNQAEFTFLYNKLSNQCISDLSDLMCNVPEPLINLGSARSINSSASDREEHSLQSVVENCSKMPPSPRRDLSRKARRVSDVTGMKEKCRQCDELRQEIGKLRRTLEIKRAKKVDKDCSKCKEHIKKIKILEDSRESLKTIEDSTTFNQPTRDTDDELTELKRRLHLLEQGYEAQILILKEQYENNLGSQSDVNEENVRERYQLEIKHLRELCEKGLTAMEASHQTVINNLQEKHKQELQALQSEKEEALAEETQATLAALDAMRKAHEAEVQKEIHKFKEEFLKQDSASSKKEDIGAVRSEIIELSEKYSAKCLQAASLEEKIETYCKQLSDARIEIANLESRNRQLKAKLSQKASALWSGANENPKAEIEARQTELILKEEEISNLKLQLKKCQTPKNNADKVVHLTKHDNSSKERFCEVNDQFPKIEPSRSCVSLTTLTSKDIRRSSSFSASSLCLLEPNSQYISSDGLPSPFSGFVASRKKVFETSSLRAKKSDLSQRKLFFQATSTEC